MLPDPRDAEFVETVVSAVIGLMAAVRQDDTRRIVGEINLLLTAIVEINKTLGDRPSDEALRRAVSALSR